MQTIHSFEEAVLTNDEPVLGMETTEKGLTAIERLRKLVAVKEEAQRDAQWRYKNDPEYRAVFDRLKQESAIDK